MATTTAFPHLQNQTYMNLTTYRKSGVAVTTPVWFAQEGDKLYVFTAGESGKVKRIRNNGTVEVAPCNASGKALGESQSAIARLLSPEEGKRADAIVTRKYGWQKRIFGLIGMIRRAQPFYIEIREGK